LKRFNYVIVWYSYSSGGITGKVADIRIIFSVALKVLVNGIALCRNNPSGKLVPSQADKDLTQKMKVAARCIDARVIDHLIV
tara:strand:+ start:349 stop:594 length:246 start_codon:yes stop_codon:yes gene_type:complete